MSSSRGPSPPRAEPAPPALAGRFFTAEPLSPPVNSCDKKRLTQAFQWLAAPRSVLENEDPSSLPHPSASLSLYTPPLLTASLTVTEPGSQTRARRPPSDAGLPPPRSVGVMLLPPHLLAQVRWPATVQGAVSSDLVTL